MTVSFDLGHPDFLAKLKLLQTTDPAQHNTLINFFAVSTNTPFAAFMSLNGGCIHNAPHFFANTVFAHFIPNVLGQFEIYAELETNNSIPTGLITPISFWKPSYLR